MIWLICVAVLHPTPAQLSLLMHCLSQSIANDTGAERMLRTFFGTVDHSGHESFLKDRCLQAPPGLPALSIKQVCIACDTSCKNSRALRKHQLEFCERKFEWICPACPDQIFGLQDRLNRHHFDAHATTCPHCCDKQKSYPSDHCKTVLSQCFRKMADKKAWGCPCCSACFQSLDAWNKHNMDHITQNERVANWNFSTMVRSLLQQQDLATIYNRYDWFRCDWSGFGKDECWNLRLALERHVLPLGLEEYPKYSCLPILEAVALYVFNTGATQRVHVDSTDTNQFPSGFATPSFSGDGMSELSMAMSHDTTLLSQPQVRFENDFHPDDASYDLSLSASRITNATADSEELISWDTFLREDFTPSVGCGMYNINHAGGYEVGFAPQQHAAPGSVQRHQDPRNLFEQQKARKSSRAGFRRRVRSAIGRGSYTKHCH
jgi:hypothetical protein